MGTKILNCLKKIVTLFSYIVWPSAMKFSTRGIGAYKVLRDFSGSTNFWQWISRISCRSPKKFGSIRGLANGHYIRRISWTLIRGRACHAATCISPSLMHVLLWSPICNKADHYIFCPVISFYLLLSFFFSSPISAATDWMSTILPHMAWP